MSKWQSQNHVLMHFVSSLVIIYEVDPSNSNQTDLWYYIQNVMTIGITQTMWHKVVITLPSTNGVNKLEIITAKIGNLDGDNLKNMQMHMEEQPLSALNAAAAVSVSYSINPFANYPEHCMKRQQFPILLFSSVLITLCHFMSFLVMCRQLYTLTCQLVHPSVHPSHS